MPDVGEQALLERDALLRTLREHRSAALGPLLVGLAEDQVEDVQGALAPGREAVAAHGAVGDVVGVAFGDAAVDDQVAHLRVRVEHEAAEPAALRALARHLELVDLVAAGADQVAHGALDVGLIARRAGVVDGHAAAAAQAGRAVGQADVAQHLPQRHRLELGQPRREDGLAGGTGEDQAWRAETLEVRAQAGQRLVEEGVLTGPVGRRAAAVQQEPGGRRVALAQVGVGALHLGGVRRRELAAGKNTASLASVPGSVPRERGPLADGEPQVLHREVEGRGRHAALPHHLAAGVADHLGHVEVGGTDLVAQAAAAAGVDHPVGRATAPAHASP